jgi:hypothetical protein
MKMGGGREGGLPPSRAVMRLVLVPRRNPGAE